MRYIVLILLGLILTVFTGPLSLIVFLLFCAIDLQNQASNVASGIESPLITNRDNVLCMYCCKSIVAEVEIRDGGIRGRTCNSCKKFNKLGG